MDLAEIQALNDPLGAQPVTLAPEPERLPSIRIIREVAAKHDLTENKVRSHDRHRGIVIARCEAIRRIGKAWPNQSYEQIGLLFGGLDHTSVKNHFNRTGPSTCVCDKYNKFRQALVEGSEA